MHRRIAALQQGLAGHDLQRRVVGLGQQARDRFDLARPHVVGRGVDHVAGERAGVGDRLDLRQGLAGPDRQARTRLGGFGLVAIEPIAAQGEGECGGAGVDPVGEGLEGVEPRRQLARQGAQGGGAQRRLRPKAKQHASYAARGIGQEQDLAGLGGEIVQLGRRRRRGVQARQGRGAGLPRQRLDRNGAVAARRLDQHV